MNPVADNTVVDREIDAEKSQGPSDPRIRCPLCGWSPRKEDRWSCDCGNEWNTFDTGGRLPLGLSSRGCWLEHCILMGVGVSYQSVGT